ncbi:MAG TPA: SUMF1/EgtB/PvdO family nonheme iron enzyme, partial [Candidatus Acidoferrum sp.]|nr:SUMF1/EgtB/PvdO family nonheme iron enzyme [Candidatus Acidoferrum sp.]
VEWQNRVAVARRVAGRTREGQTALERARGLASGAVAERERAFSLFREAHLADAEGAWARALALGAETDVGMADAARLFEIALAQDPSRDDVRRRLGEAIYERALLAERDRRSSQEDELLQRLRLYDPDGSWQRAWVAPMRLTVTTRPAPARATIARYVDREGALRLEPGRALGRSPVSAIELEPGSYLLTLEAAGRYPVRYPLVASRGGVLAVSVDLPTAAEVPPGYVFIPPGSFLFGSGGDEEARRGFFVATPIHERTTAGYFIAIDEVTCADWIAYLDDLPDRERAERTPVIEERQSGKAGLRLERESDGAWTLQYGTAGHDYKARWGEPFRYRARRRRAEQDWRRFPITGVSALDAEAYTAWLDRTGRLPGARLCTEAEWERAARGADGRDFPAGSRLSPDDANIDETYGKAAAAIGPDEVGSYPQSASPFGLDDASGNAFEWTTSVLAKGGYLARGGSYYYDVKSAQLSNRAESVPTLRDASTGIRVCASHSVRI